MEGHQKEKGVRNLDWWAKRNHEVDAMTWLRVILHNVTTVTKTITIFKIFKSQLPLLWIGRQADLLAIACQLDLPIGLANWTPSTAIQVFARLYLSRIYADA